VRLGSPIVNIRLLSEKLRWHATAQPHARQRHAVTRAIRALWRVSCGGERYPAPWRPSLTGAERVSPHRTFRDDETHLWNAWDVHPVWGERRAHERRLMAGSPPPALRDRRRIERRRDMGLRISLPPRLASGWIAFECGEDRRRIAPIPEGWSELGDEGLRELLKRADQLPPRRKRLVE
jgi:hypothetical protein